MNELLSWLMRQLNRFLTTARNDELRARWERRTDPFLLALAAAMVPLIVGPYVSELSDAVERWFLIGDIVIWVFFAVDLAVRIWLAENRRRFLLAHWAEVLIVIVPVFRPLRLLRLLLLMPRISEILKRRAVGGSLAAALIAIVLATIAVALIEQSGGGQIGDWGTALWWALATITTVGYGDVVPETLVGRIIGSLLMIVGIGVFGVLTANVAAWFIESDDDAQQQILDELKSIRSEVESLREDLERRN
ncbi:MAG: potassium channel family protein [Chloroflexi bacterium]|nr:potassium channel family protein [Chloroflexota bacterium]MCY3588535.1 potassium channel family protein [Chloroflexota bacterium]MCY3685579.1 potassium channel family protein [Chloroflexota bacterium]MDE2708481.1 potassium channel family protein [Chloroflexota bacterium]